ncbi:TRAP transporter small permease subunit [Rhodosalinus halophilus]|uniref:TRAP transporter small permease subunit n=1 Tax=Rhodosalinus halophilus TaxID=2259333 RepID=UPI0018F2AC07|nr:TRAP transporter small permease subunit [Rhodosalinus halophilus]
MPELGYTLPHWAYWVGLIVFPIVAMALARRPRPERRTYSLSLGYMILVTGGMLGLHRFYLRNLWGLLFIPVFLAILFANAQGQDARSALSDASNTVRVAERTLERERARVSEAEASLPELRAEAEAAEEGSFALRSAERQLQRAERTIERGRATIAEAEAELAEAQPVAEAARADLDYWAGVARWAFYILLAGIALDALLLPAMVSKANGRLSTEDEQEAQAALEDAEETAGDARFVSPGWTGWIDRLSLFCGEFVAYWAVIAVFVYYFEVISRYVFNSPTNWAHEAMYLMFGMQYLVAGAYAMLTESHVRVDVFYARMSPRRKAITDILTSVFFFIFAFTLLFTSWTFAMDAIAVPSGNALVSDWARGEISLAEVAANWDMSQWTDPNIRWGEISFNEWEIPLWPMKWVMVVGGLLLVLQGVSKLAQDLRIVVRGY